MINSPRKRMIPETWFNDDRLAAVSLGARSLALCLESVAETHGVLELDVRAIRNQFSYFLGTDDEPASMAQVTGWLDELISVWWLVVCERNSQRLGYLKGFGARQQGPNVGIGISKATGALSPHLRFGVPECVVLDTTSEAATKWVNSNRARPVHCEKPYTACAQCSWRVASEASYQLATSEPEQHELEPESESQSELDLNPEIEEGVGGGVGEGTSHTTPCVQCGGTGVFGITPCPACSTGRGDE